MTLPKKNTKKITEHDIIYDLHEFGILIGTREIFLTSSLLDSIDDALIDHRSASFFIKNLQLLNSINSDPIVVHQITCGGDWNFGIAIYDAIRNSCEDPQKSNIIILIHGFGSSMSSIIPQASSQRIIMPNADFMIHWGSESLVGNYTSVQSSAEWSRIIADKMLDIYVERCQGGKYWKSKKMSPQKVKSWLKDKMDKKQEVFMSAEEAVDKGFVDGILGSKNFESIETIKSV